MTPSHEVLTLAACLAVALGYGLVVWRVMPDRRQETYADRRRIAREGARPSDVVLALILAADWDPTTPQSTTDTLDLMHQGIAHGVSLDTQRVWIHTHGVASFRDCVHAGYSGRELDAHLAARTVPDPDRTRVLASLRDRTNRPTTT